MAIEFRLNVEKAVEATAILLKFHVDKTIEYGCLLKMLYLSDRMALDEIEMSITSDRAVSTKCGPILVGIHDLMQEKPPNEQFLPEDAKLALRYWSQFISTKGNSISLIEDPGNNALCEAAVEILEKVYKSCKNLDLLDTADWAKNLPEWKNPTTTKDPDLAIPIKPKDILKSIGKTEEEITCIEEEIYREQYFDRVLNRPIVPMENLMERAAS